MTYQTEELLSTALAKIGGQKEKDLCKYLPGGETGYMHHFTLKKIKRTRPEELKALINEFIIEQPNPRMIDPKPRSKRKHGLALNQNDMKLILKLAQKTGDTYLLSKLGAKMSLPRIKRELIQSIKAGKIEEELWNAYVQSIDATRTVSEN